jgi:hypothetical protein
MAEQAMTVETCGLGQALLALKGSWTLLPEAHFLASSKAKDLPKDRTLQEALIFSLVDSRIGHKGKLVVMDFDYSVDDTGNPVRREVELGVLDSSYQTPAETWHVDRVDFYGSFLDLEETPEKFRPLSGIDRPWVRLKDIRVPTSQLLAATSTVSPSRRAGGRPSRIDWDAFWIELVCQIYLEGKPKDDDLDWTELNATLRKQFTDRDDSAMRGRTRQLRTTLRERGYIRSTSS